MRNFVVICKLFEENLTLVRGNENICLRFGSVRFASRSSIYALTDLNAHYICERRKDFPFQNFTYVGVLKFFRHYFTWRIIKSYRSIDIRRYLLAIRIINPSCYNAFVVSSRRNSLYVYRLLNFIHSSLNYYSIFFFYRSTCNLHSLTYLLTYFCMTGAATTRCNFIDLYYRTNISDNTRTTGKPLQIEIQIS